jgi:hypothetical protein
MASEVLHVFERRVLSEQVGDGGDAEAVGRERFRQAGVRKVPLHHLAHGAGAVGGAGQGLAFTSGGAALRFNCVAAAVNFDYELRFEAKEIRDVRTYGILPAEFGAFKLPVAQMRPEFLLRVGARAAQASRAVANQRRSRRFSGGKILHCGPSPAPAAAASSVLPSISFLRNTLTCASFTMEPPPRTPFHRGAARTATTDNFICRDLQI